MNKTNRYITIFAGIFFVLCVVAFEPYYREYFDYRNFWGKGEGFEIVIPKNIDQITIFQDSDTTIDFTRESEFNWTVNGKRADASLVSEFVSDLEAFELDSLVSTNPNKFDLYEASDSGKKIAINGADPFIVGMRGPQINSSYVRPENLDKVFIASVDLHNYIIKDVDYWRDKTLLAVTSDIERVQFTKDSETVILEKNESEQWLATKGNDTRILGEVGAQRLFDTLDPFKARSIANLDQIALLENLNPTLSLEITQTGQEPITFDFSDDKNTSTWLVRSDSLEEVFTLSNATYQVLIDGSFTLFE